MTIKELAYIAQHHLQAHTGTQFKRAHIYELLAAAFGFNSYAALCAEAVFTEQSLSSRRAADFGEHIRDRCLEIGYQLDTAKMVAGVLPALMTEHKFGLVRIPDLIAYLRAESGYGSWPDEDEQGNRNEVRWWTSSDELVSPLMLDGLNAAASRGHAAAHYALALIHAPAGDDFDAPGVGSDYWYMQAQNGRVLTGVEQEWADAHATRLAQDESFSLHLREAARLGHREALLELADRFDEPAFFEQATDSVNANPSWVADIAERMGRPEDAKKWLTEAAKRGDTEAMLQLIEDYDRENLQQCWTWVYLAELLGADLTKDEYVAIHEDGSRYDDDVGGPMFVDGRDGVKLEPMSEAQDAAARRVAHEIFEGVRLLTK
ncbi:hypothetical protein SAMN05216321_106121 [Cupriavidus sp. OV038]|uniref:hypothetical protein n=1 Tax=unclassified Cupriavidus TaxID=2640874 RepID=UPI0008EFA37B|nr:MULTISPECIES: hypothetical protein [unclassified Cupriavidus]SFC69651.1 hypothetical protein SAMN05216321_106121 [Cupriavidus sp. OV038]SFO73303.1 hypothetical protein SAMN05216322_102121 [Cupriavidus sp. OV096]